MGVVLSRVEREFHFTDRDFRRVRELLHKRAGISLSTVKRELVYGRLSRRLRTLGLTSFRDYLDRLPEIEGEDERFVNALTTNLTSFFREPEHFVTLARYVKERGLPSSLTVWCAASSTGEEPYSIAMTLGEAYGKQQPSRVVASDVDTDVLDSAQRGVYRAESIERIERPRRERWFLRGTGKNAGSVRIRPELRDRVRFERINLQEPHWPLPARVDVVFLRNVLIYFDRPTQQVILTRVHALLPAEGLVFTGHSESLHYAADRFAPLPGTSTTYRKR